MRKKKITCSIIIGLFESWRAFFLLFINPLIFYITLIVVIILTNKSHGSDGKARLVLSVRTWVRSQVPAIFFSNFHLQFPMHCHPKRLPCAVTILPLDSSLARSNAHQWKTMVHPQACTTLDLTWDWALASRAWINSVYTSLIQLIQAQFAFLFYFLFNFFN